VEPNGQVVWQSTDGHLKFVAWGDNLKVVGESSSATYSVKDGLKHVFGGKWNVDKLMPKMSFWSLTRAKYEEMLKDYPNQLELISAMADKAHKARQAEKSARSSPSASDEEPSPKRAKSEPSVGIVAFAPEPKFVWILFASHRNPQFNPKRFVGVYDSEESANEHKTAFSCCIIKKVLLNSIPFDETSELEPTQED